MKTTLFLACLHILLMGNQRAATAQSINGSMADTTSLKGGWFLQPLLPSDTAAGKLPMLQLDPATGHFSGSTGCNSMRGSFQKTDTSLVFNQNLITTRMDCTGYNEAAFIKNLLRTNGYKFVKGQLVLLFDATELSRWTRKPEHKPVTIKARISQHSAF